MKYTVVKMGGGEHMVDLPESHQYDFHVIGMIGHNGKFIATHASLEEIVELRPSLEKVGIQISFNTKESPVHDDSIQMAVPEQVCFTLNKTAQWREFVNGRPVCWLAWYAGKADQMFFVPQDFCWGVHFKPHWQTLGIFDVTTKDVIFKAVCAPDTAMREITEIL